MNYDPITGSVGGTAKLTADTYHDRDKLQNRGAKWDKAKRCWYVEQGDNIRPLLRWKPVVDGQEITAPPLTPELRAQARLMKICKDDSIDKVHHTGVCTRGRSGAAPIPYYFFTKSSSQSVVHRSGVRFYMSKARLYVEVTSSGEDVFQLRRADGGVIILEAKQPEEVNRGDRVEMSSVTNSGKFCLANTFLVHRAPHKQLPAPNHSKVASLTRQNCEICWLSVLPC